MKKNSISTGAISREARNKLVTNIWIYLKPTSYARSHALWSKSHAIQLSDFLKIKIHKTQNN